MIKSSILKLSRVGLIFGSLVGGLVLAEEPSNGTLPDGTPFRRDAQGVEVIDYVAELENSVTYLKDRVRELEQQVETGRDTITLLKEEKSKEEPRAIAEPKLFEADLDVTSGSADSLINAPSETKTEVRPSIIADKSAQSVKTAKAERKVAVIDSPQIIQARSHRQSMIDRTKLGNPAVPELDQLVIHPVAIEKPLQRLSNAEPRMAPKIIQPTIVKPAPKRLDPIEIAKAEIRKDFLLVKKLKAERDAAFKVYSENPGANSLKITPTILVSNRKRSIERLELDTKTASREREIVQIRGEIAQIRKLINDDIALVNRILKLN
jgi:hypothetical protein